MENFNPDRPVSIYLCGCDFKTGSEFVSGEHRHSFYQLNLVSSGYARMATAKGERIISAGDAVLIPPEEPHTLCLENASRFCDYSFKFFIHKKIDFLPEYTIFTEPEFRVQQRVWIRALGEIFRSVAPLELLNTAKEFPLDPSLPGVELLEELIWGFCRKIIANANSVEPWLIRKIKLLVQNQRGAPLSVEECANHFHCSAGHLLTLVRRESGMTTKEIIDRERIKIAKHFLAYSDISITLLAARMHFNDMIYFDKFFRKYAGESPGQYRKREKNKFISA